MNDTDEQRLATCHLARARAGASDYNRDLILKFWPDIPLEGDLSAWLAIHPNLCAEVCQIDPELPPQEDGWKMYTLADAYKPRPPIQYVVEGLLALPSLSIIYASPGCFKSLLLLDLCACVVGGFPWLPPLPEEVIGVSRKTLQNPAWFLDFDNGLRRMHERAGAVGRIRELQPDAPLYYTSMPSPWLDSSDWDQVAKMADKARAREVKLMILDNLRDISGKIEENSSEMGTIMSHFRRLAEEIEGAVCIIHHQRKAGISGSREGDSLRGHSSIEGAVDLALLVDREPYSDTAEVRATKVRGADVPPFGVRFTYEHKPETLDLWKLKFFGMEVEDLKSDMAIKRVIIETLRDNPATNQSNLVNITKSKLHDVGSPRITQQIAYLISMGKIVMERGQRNANLYSLPDVRDIDI